MADTPTTLSSYDALAPDDPEAITECVVAAAEAHAEANGDFEYALGDLEIALGIALGLMTPDQRVAFLRDYRETAYDGLEDDT